MKWQKEFAIGCQWIDMQHQSLIGHVDHFEEMAGSKIDSQQLVETIKFLVKYARDHFNDEEKLMSEIQFPEFDRQKQLHDEFINYITQVLLDLNRGQTIHPQELICFLSEWIKNHVLHEDKKIGNFIRENNLNCERNNSG